MTKSCLYFGRVMHKRLRPFRHRLDYRVFSLYLDLDELPQLSRRLRLFSHNRWNLFGFLDRDTDRFLFRSPRTGDRINLHGGSKTVKKLFAQWRVAISDSWKIPVVESTGGIVAILGGLFGYEDRYCPGLPNEQENTLKSVVHRYDVEVE